MTDATISVVMAVHNGTKYVRLAVESVLNQDFRALEFVIVDDASTDDTADIIASYRDDRIVYIRNAGNIGQTRSLNLGLARARGEFVARIDADDIYLPGKLTRQYEYMTAHPDVAVCGTAATRIDADGRPFGSYVPPVRDEDVRFCACQRSPVCHVSVMMRRSAVMEQGGYDERYRYAADYALWSTLLACGRRIANLPDVLIQYREFVQSLGAVHKLGTAGDEAAEIIQGNIRTIGRASMSREECRTIALLYFPSAGLTGDAIAGAYLSLSRIARIVYGRVPMRVRAELAGLLAWSLTKTAGRPRNPGEPNDDSLGRTAWAYWRHPAVVLACAAASGAAWLGPDRITRLKEMVMPVVLRRLR